MADEEFTPGSEGTGGVSAGDPAAGNAPEGADERTLRYTVRVGSSVTHLFLERKRADRGFDMRWYVIPKRYA